MSDFAVSVNVEVETEEFLSGAKSAAQVVRSLDEDIKKLNRGPSGRFASVKVTVEGSEEAMASYERLADEFDAAVAQAVFLEANDIMNRSQELVPVDTGTLKSSGSVEPPDISPGHVVVRLGYGGAASEYAVVVHENLDAYHAPPTQAKYLEQPAMEALEGMGDRIASFVFGEVGF